MFRYFCRFFAITSLIAFVCLPASAKETPEAVYAKFLSAMRNQGMMATVDFTHPDEFTRFKAMLAPAFTEAKNLDQREVQMFKKLFGPDATPQSVTAMPAKDFFSAFVRFLEIAANDVNLAVGQSIVLGAVQEGEFSHLVVRTSVTSGDLNITKLNVVTFKPYGETWRMTLTGNVEGMAQTLRKLTNQGK